MENEMVNRYRHAPNPKMYIFFSDFKMKNNNKAVVPLLFFYCVTVSCTLTS